MPNASADGALGCKCEQVDVPANGRWLGAPARRFPGCRRNTLSRIGSGSGIGASAPSLRIDFLQGGNAHQVHIEPVNAAFALVSADGQAASISDSRRFIASSRLRQADRFLPVENAPELDGAVVAGADQVRPSGAQKRKRISLVEPRSVAPTYWVLRSRRSTTPLVPAMAVICSSGESWTAVCPWTFEMTCFA